MIRWLLSLFERPLPAPHPGCVVSQWGPRGFGKPYRVITKPKEKK
jgi:hypothetical protein